MTSHPYRHAEVHPPLKRWTRHETDRQFWLAAGITHPHFVAVHVLDYDAVLTVVPRQSITPLGAGWIAIPADRLTLIDPCYLLGVRRVPSIAKLVNPGVRHLLQRHTRKGDRR